MKAKNINNRLKPPGVKTAAVSALQINALIYLLFLVMFIYGRSAVIPSEVDMPPRGPHPPISWWMLLHGLLSTYLYVFLLLCVNFYILRQNAIPAKRKTALAILVSLLFIVVWNQLSSLVMTSLFDLPPPDNRGMRGAAVRDTVLGGLVVFSSQLMYSNYRRQVVALENQALKAEYERARYETLKSQVNPHFLFNTFNTLNSIVVKDPEMAQRYIQKLSSIFRYTVQSRDVTTLAAELEFTKDYCDLMQIRYGENLNFEFDVKGKYNTYSVVSFSVQTLVENAIKHNVITSRQPLTVTIFTDPDDYLCVSNPVNPKKDPETGEGIGLANLSERYRLKWGEDIIINNDGKTFVVRIPLIREGGNKNLEK